MTSKNTTNKKLRILVLHGPNLNMLGKRDKKHYGSETLNEINMRLQKKADELQCELKIVQSNHEGMLIDTIQENTNDLNGIVINPGALTHYSIALRDALEDSGLPVIEVHLSDISQREDFRKTSVIHDVVLETVQGHKGDSYMMGLENMIKYIKNT